MFYIAIKENRGKCFINADVVLCVNEPNLSTTNEAKCRKTALIYVTIKINLHLWVDIVQLVNYQLFNE